MKNQKIGILDNEFSYAYHLMEAINRKRQIAFEAEVFSNKESLLQYLENHSLDVLLIDHKEMSAQLACYSIKKIILLSEVELISDFEEYPMIYKYQSSEAIIREIMSYYAKSGGTSRLCSPRKIKIYGIYSPVRQEDNTAFAIALGYYMAKKKSVLYFCLEMFTGIREEFGSVDGKNIADLMYYVNHDKEGIIYILSSMVQNLMGMDWIQPPDSPMDVQDIEVEDWLKVLEVITMQSNYERLLIQINEGVPEFHRILEHCDRIFMPVSENVLITNPQKEYEKFLTKIGKEILLEKTETVKLPYFHKEDFNSFTSFVLDEKLKDVICNIISEEENAE